jgi:hypothetical protein
LGLPNQIAGAAVECGIFYLFPVLDEMVYEPHLISSHTGRPEARRSIRQESLLQSQ